jgi:orotate phosphoribosyltransferase
VDYRFLFFESSGMLPLLAFVRYSLAGSVVVSPQYKTHGGSMGTSLVDLAKRVYRISNIKGHFVLRSGITSNEYFDKYRFEADPVLLQDIAEAMTALIPESTEALAGLELGGVPLATMISHFTGLPVLFVRKQAKTYGTCKLAEGGEIAGRKLVIVEDVITSGGQVIESANELRDLGAKILRVVCVIDREQGGAANLHAHDLEFHPLLTMSAMKEVVQEAGE